MLHNVTSHMIVRDLNRSDCV